MFIENIIIGAGPAGLQAAYYFEKLGINYLIIEKELDCGSFFSKYPHSGKLISINKPNTGNTDPNFNLRHDWNSLLNDEGLYFPKYSESYYPDKELLVQYLNDFKNANNLKILFGKQVQKISPVTQINTDSTSVSANYEILIESTDEIFYCNKLIMATGLSKPYIPKWIFKVKDKIKHYANFPKNYFLDKKNLEEFKNKKVLIFGGGNASFELANILNEICSHIIILGRNTHRKFAITSHYSGDIRSIYLPFLDTFLLKSLNAFDYRMTLSTLEQENKTIKITQTETNSKYQITILDKTNKIETPFYNFTESKRFDKIIFCTGWEFDNSIFAKPLETVNSKYPKIKKNYESVSAPNMFFIGSLMHSHDFRKSSGGFIHGFRYLIKLFMQINYKMPFSIQNFNIKELTDLGVFVQFIMHRINTASSIYQMFSVLCDKFAYKKNNQSINYVMDVIPDMPVQGEYDIQFILTLEYGRSEVTNLYDLGVYKSGTGYENYSSLLHPVLRILTNTNELVDVIHFDEDLVADFSSETKYFNKFLRIFKIYLL